MRAICGAQLKDRKRSSELMSILGLKNHRTDVYCKQCSLAWSCAEERGWSCLLTSIRLDQIRSIRSKDER